MGRDGDEADDDEGEGNAGEHGEDERSHVSRVDESARHPQIDTPAPISGGPNRDTPAAPTRLAPVTDEGRAVAIPGPDRPRRRLPVALELLLAVLAIALVQAFVVKPFGVPSQSMEQTLRIGDRIVVNRMDSSITRGDVIVFGHGDTWDTARRSPASDPVRKAVRTLGDVTGMGPSNTNYTVKRVIGMPGDTVSCCSPEGALLVNGEPLHEPYVHEDLPFDPSVGCSADSPGPRCFGEVTVPRDSYLVLGDHRSQSADSIIACRSSTAATSGCAKFVDRSRVIGPVVLRLWPLSAFGSID